MTEFGLVHLGFSLLAVGLLVLGYLGLMGQLSVSHIVVAIILGVVILVAFVLGRFVGKDDQAQSKSHEKE